MNRANHYTDFTDAVQYLFNRGAHLIPLKGSYHINYDELPPAEYDKAKQPKRSWRKYPVDKQRNESQANYRQANNWMGLIPSSVGLVCLDLDEGNQNELSGLLSKESISFATIKTRRGYHFIMPAADDWPKGNWNWQYKSCKGEIRHDNGYILLWNPNRLVEFLEQRDQRPAGKSLADVIRKKRGRPPKAKTAESQSELDFGPYPPGDRDEQLFIDLSKLVRQRKDDDKRVAKIKNAWLTAPDPKNQGRKARSQIFEEKLRRLRDEREEQAQFQFDQKDAEALRQSLAKLKIAFKYNERANRFEWKIDGQDPTTTDDSLVHWLIEEIASTFTYRRGNGQHPLRYSTTNFYQYMGALCYHPERRYDPFIRWLETLPKWDGQARIDNFLTEHFKAPAEALSRWASRYPYIAAIQRAHKPGCKLDEMPVLIGKQGLGKTAFVQSLFPESLSEEWYSSSIDFTATVRERVEAIMGTVVVEIGEMAGVGLAMQKQKVFLSQTTDQVRLAYDRRKSVMPRRSIFVGTADRKEVLPNDPAGNRRFVAIELQTGCPIEKIMDEQRNQLWAEARSMYEAGMRANLPRELINQQRRKNEDYRQTDDEFENLVAELNEGQFYTLNDLMDEWDIKFPSNIQKKRIADAMQNHGFERMRPRIGNSKKRGWMKTKS